MQLPAMRVAGQISSTARIKKELKREQYRKSGFHSENLRNVAEKQGEVKWTGGGGGWEGGM